MDDTSIRQDAGQYVPFARKHLVENQEQRVQSTLTLANVWTEPDWVDMVASGQDRELAARKFIGYQSIRNRPRAGGIRGFSQEDWNDAYMRAVRHLRRIYEAATRIDELRNIGERLRDALGLSTADCNNGVNETNIVYWAAGLGGERILKGAGPSTLRLREMARWLGKLGWPESDAAWRTSIVPAQLQDDRTWRVCQVEGKVWVFIDKTVYMDEASAIAAAKAAAIAKLASVETSSKLVPRRPRAALTVERVGPDHRNGSDVTADDLMRLFGLRAIQYGNSVSVKDRQRWLNQTFDGLADMADVLGMKRSWLGLGYRGKSLALAIGARGVGGGGANAHYERDLRVINQTYRSGFGALAHEFGHALDHRIGIRSNYDVFASEHWDYFQFAQHSPKTLAILEKVKAIVDFATDPSTRFFQQAKNIAQQHRAGSYWTEALELFARSFEAYVQDSLSQLGRENSSLVYGTLAADYDLSTVAACPYPIGQDRQVLNQLHLELISTLIQPETLA